MSINVDRSRRESQPSYLISDEENHELFRVIGPRCQSIATAVAQVLSADPPGRTKWSKKHIGLLCFIKDHSKRSYFFRMYCLERQGMIWEQELYVNFEYSAPRPYFHTFEGDTSRIGLSFADIDEAANFLTAVNEHLRSRAEKLANRRRSQQQRTSRISASVAGKERSTQTNQYGAKKKQSTEEAQTSKRPIANKFNTLRKKAKDKHKKLKKTDIGEPMNFEHVSHAGLDPDQGFSLVNVDSQLLKFFQFAGVSEKQLNNKETRKFIFDFIDKHGGTEAIIREATEPAKVAHQHHGEPTKRQAPATPQMTKVPVPAVKPPSPPTIQHEKTAASNIPPPPPMANITQTNSVPPPPPLPVPKSKPITLQDVHSLPAPPPTDSHGELMNAIREGQKLKTVEEVTRRISNSDPKSDLLEQIRAGKELKHVEKSEESASKEVTPEGIAGALARALQERNRVIHSDSDRSDRENEDDDWDDCWED